MVSMKDGDNVRYAGPVICREPLAELFHDSGR
jgi:hypothetical protein